MKPKEKKRGGHLLSGFTFGKGNRPLQEKKKNNIGRKSLQDPYQLTHKKERRIGFNYHESQVSATRKEVV